MSILTKDIQKRRKSRGILIMRIVWGREHIEGLTKDGLNNWIRMVSYWVRSGAMTASSMFRHAREYMDTRDYSNTEYSEELDEKIRREFSDSVAAYVKERRERMGAKDPQRIYKRMMVAKKSRQQYIRKGLARQAVFDRRCPICYEGLASPPATEKGEFALPDCHGYGGVWRYVEPSPTQPDRHFEKVCDLEQDIGEIQTTDRQDLPGGREG